MENQIGGWARLRGMRDFLCIPPYEFCGGLVYYGFQVGLGLVPQVGLETMRPGGPTGAGTWGLSRVER